MFARESGTNSAGVNHWSGSYVSKAQILNDKMAAATGTKYSKHTSHEMPFLPADGTSVKSS
jgi:hypothetical protein